MATKNEQQSIEFYEEGISFKELFLIFWRKRVLISLMTIIGGLIGATTSIAVNATTSNVSAIVELQWNGIENGEYPDGSRFEAFNAFTPNVYSKVISSLALNIEVNELRDTVSVSPIIPNDILQLITVAVEEGESFSYFPSVFKFTIDIGTIGLTDAIGKQLLDNLLFEFSNEFKETFISQTIVRNVTFINYENFDLLDQVTTVNSQINLISKTLVDFINANPSANTFRATSNSLSLPDILSQISLIQSLQLSTVEALIVTNQLSKDIPLTISKLTYNNRLLNVDLAKAQQFLSELNDLVTNYTGSTSTIIIPGYEGQINTTSALDNLYAKIIETQQTISQLEQNIIYNELLISEFEAALVNVELNSRAQNEINSVVESIDALIDSTNAILTEFNSLQNRNITKVLANATIEPGASLILYSAVGLFVAGFAALFIAYFITPKEKK